jgi:hypothetical protein
VETAELVQVEMDNDSSSSSSSNINPISFNLFGYDPSILEQSKDSDYIFAEGPEKQNRGRFEYAFSRIGLSFLTGGAIGWAIGGYNGIRHSRFDLALQMIQNPMEGTSSFATGSAAAGSQTAGQASWAVRRSHILNYITKTGANTANTFGIVALTYSLLNLGISFATDREDVTTLTAATSTGLIYRYISKPKPQVDSTGLIIHKALTRQMRMQRAAVGGAMGLAAGIVILALTTNNKYLNTPHTKLLH